MPRKKGDSLIVHQVEDVLALITDTQTLTWDELFDVAVQWCRKNYDQHVSVAKEKGVVPIALLITALLYVEHPLLVSQGRGWKYGFLEASAQILLVQLEERDVPEPVRVQSTHSIHIPVN